MRAIRLLLAGSLLAAGGCKWADFDDLKEDTWVTSTGRPETAAENWGVAIARVGLRGDGGKLAVLGASDAVYSEIVAGPNGDVVVDVDSERELVPDFGLGNLALEPLFLSRPDADEVALVTALEASRILVIRATATGLTPVSVTGLMQPSGATYMVAPPRMGDPGPSTGVLVAQNENVFGAYFERAPSGVSKCALHDELGDPIDIRALGAYRPDGAAYDDVLALTITGKLLIYDGAVFHSCPTVQGPRPGQVRDLEFPDPLLGSQILTFVEAGAAYALVQLHGDGSRGRLGLYRIGASSIDRVGEPRDVDRVKTAALFQPAGGSRRFVLAGQPTAAVEGVTGGGQVQVLELDLAAGIAASPEMTLFDARPEEGQAFGRGVAELPYNGQKIIAVAADNDVFLYFRTALYGETREGR